MDRFGEWLREKRKNKGYSLNNVYEKTGITDSRLSKAENGLWNNLKIDEMKLLANLYDVSIIYFCLMAGLFCKEDLRGYGSYFKNVELLSEDERKHIQLEIDFILENKKNKLST